jgi:hypothetical protein
VNHDTRSLRTASGTPSVEIGSCCVAAFHPELFDRIVLIYNPANPRIPLTLAESVRDDLCRRFPDILPAPDCHAR